MEFHNRERNLSSSERTFEHFEFYIKLVMFKMFCRCVGKNRINLEKLKIGNLPKMESLQVLTCVHPLIQTVQSR